MAIPAPRRVAVIGGGLAGLAAAHRLRELDPAAEVVLLEATSRVGGILETTRREGWLIERSADMFSTREPWALDLCRRIGIAEELIETDVRFRRAYVVRRGKLFPVPEGFTLMSPSRVWPIVTTPLLSLRGKLRLAWEYFVPGREGIADESLESLVVRRFGREAFDRLVQPLIGGIYTADPAKLSVAATLPQFVELEREHGSLIRGIRRKQAASRGKEAGTGARYAQFVAPRDGMQRLVDALAARLPPEVIRLGAPVERVSRSTDCWEVTIQGEASPLRCDDLIVAVPGHVATRLLQDVDQQLADLLGEVTYAGCSVAVLGVRQDQLARKLQGFGFVVPAIERRSIIAGSLASLKFPGRAPEGKLLMRVFVGGALQPELAGLPDEELRTLVLGELRELLGMTGEPEFFEVVRWLGMMPQYHVGHLELVSQIESQAAKLPHFALAGNSLRGVGVPFCVRSGERAAEAILASRGAAASASPEAARG